MKFSWKLERRERTTWMIIFLAGFFLGIALICLFPKSLVAESGFLDVSFLKRMRDLDINQNGLLIYSAKQRLGMAAFLVLLSAAGAAGIGAWLFLGWCGVSAGTVLTTLSLRYGIKGIIFFTGCVLPQHLLLIPGYLFLLDWCMKKMERRRLLIPLSVVIMGCFLESYVNPVVLKIVLKIF